MRKIFYVVLGSLLLMGAPAMSHALQAANSGTMGGSGNMGSNMVNSNQGNMMDSNGNNKMGDKGMMQGSRKMMSNGMMKGGMSSKVIDKSQLDVFYKIPDSGVIINKKANTIEFTGKNIKLPVAAAPSRDKMYAFGIYQLVNPTIIIKADTMVKLLLVNKDDDMYHAVMITKTPPPYNNMPMMNAKIALKGAFIKPLNHSSNGKYYEGESVFSASNPGTYYYICQVQDHAAKGMYGKLIVK